ncbi:protein FREE1-like [Bidens hawaiensis]|uniref:protein FREE1-like n=1 Tax=Bidens hawaiensis TaxID=980011 RepID=UPI00404ADED0
MNNQNEMTYPPSSSSYYYYYESDFQNPSVNPQFPSNAAASAPPDPSMYNSNYDHPSYSAPSCYHQTAHDYTANVTFDDYGRPIPSGIDQSSRVPVLQFDDYGRPITHSRTQPRAAAAADDTVSKAALKFSVILLSQGDGLHGDMDVLCQIGLDGIQLLDPATSRTLKVYALDTVTKWEVLDSSIFAFWTKSSIDMNARCVSLKSNSYTTTKILDMVAAASFQFKEMDGVTISEQKQPPAEKKKGFPDWINLMKPTNEEKDHWVPDEASTKCTACNTYFGAFVRRHHCRNCGDIFCDKCTQGRIALTEEENAQQVRVCDQCLAEVTQRLSHVNEVAGRSSGFNRHEDLAKKLQEEMEKKRKTTSELKSNMSDRKMKEVECPTCTVHLQVDVPASGSKTIECSLCQHPFLVNAH